MTEKIEDMRDYAKFLTSLVKVTGAIDENSTTGSKYVKGVLTSIMVDLVALRLLADGKMKPHCDVNQQSWDDYLKHIKRSFIIDVWSVTESWIRDIVGRRGYKVESGTQAAYRYLTEALDLVQDEKTKKLLKKASKKCMSSFIPFPDVVFPLLDDTFEKGDRDEWKRFFDAFRELRNASHNNFVAQKTTTVECRWLSKSFEESHPVRVYCEDMEAIITALIEFFELTEHTK